LSAGVETTAMCSVDPIDIATPLDPQAEFFLIPAGWKEISADIRLSRIIAISKNTAEIRLTANVFFSEIRLKSCT